MSGGVELLYYYVTPPESVGYVTVLGEYRNVTDHTIQAPVLKYVFLDGDGNVLDADQAYPIFPAMLPGETVPFEMWFEAPVDWSNETIEACETYAGPNEDPSRDLALEDVTADKSPSGELTITGKVRNLAGQPAENIEVTAVLHDTIGRYVGAASSDIEADIPPGKTARFELKVRARSIEGLRPFSANYTHRLKAHRSSGAIVTVGC